MVTKKEILIGDLSSSDRGLESGPKGVESKVEREGAESPSEGSGLRESAKEAIERIESGNPLPPGMTEQALSEAVNSDSSLTEERRSKLLALLSGEGLDKFLDPNSLGTNVDELYGLKSKGGSNN